VLRLALVERLRDAFRACPRKSNHHPDG
jgi:hypothetical protein